MTNDAAEQPVMPDDQRLDQDQEPDVAPEEGRFNRGLRVVFIVLVLLSIVSGYATRPSIHPPMRRVLRDAQIVEVVRRTPSWERPFIEWKGRELLVRHRSTLLPNGATVNMESVFTAGGFYLGSRSIIAPPLYEARQVPELERVLLQNAEQYLPMTEIPKNFSLPGFWDRIGRELDLQWMTAFQAFPVMLDVDDQSNDPPFPVMVLHIWCSKPPVRNAQEPDLTLCPQARRIVLDLDSGHIIRNDFLL